MKNEEKTKFTEKECEQIKGKLKEIFDDVNYQEMDIFYIVYSMFSGLNNEKGEVFLAEDTVLKTKYFQTVESLDPVFDTIKQIMTAAKNKSITDEEIKQFLEKFKIFFKDDKEALAKIFNNKDSRENVIEIIKYIINNVDKEKKLIYFFNLSNSFERIINLFSKEKIEIFTNKETKKNIFEFIQYMIDNVQPGKRIGLGDLEESFEIIINLFGKGKTEIFTNKETKKNIFEFIQYMIDNVQPGKRIGLYDLNKHLYHIIEKYQEKKGKKIQDILNNKEKIKEINNILEILKVALSLESIDIEEAYELWEKEKEEEENKVVEEEKKDEVKKEEEEEKKEPKEGPKKEQKETNKTFVRKDEINYTLKKEQGKETQNKEKGNKKEKKTKEAGMKTTTAEMKTIEEIINNVLKNGENIHTRRIELSNPAYLNKWFCDNINNMLKK